MALLQAVMIGLIAVAIAPGWLFYFDITPKIAILLAGTAAALFTRDRPPRWFSLLLLASLVSLAVSTALSDHRDLSLFGTNWRRYGAITQAAAVQFAWTIAAQAHHARTILRGVVIATALIAVYGVAQYFG